MRQAESLRKGSTVQDVANLGCFSSIKVELTMGTVDLLSGNAQEIDYLIHFRKARKQDTLDSMYEAMDRRMEALGLPSKVRVECYLAYGRRQDEIDRGNFYV